MKASIIFWNQLHAFTRGRPPPSFRPAQATSTCSRSLTTSTSPNNNNNIVKMEVNQSRFRQELLPILKHISQATFITFDLEMSGITTRPKYSSGDRTHDIGRPSLQQHYEEMKSAAETFQVLQVGITCVEEDREKEFYLARPYNFNLSPLSADGVELNLERTFQFSSSACDFLSRNSFDFGKVFREGIPYLSRQEEDVIREEYSNRNGKTAKIPDVVIPANEPAALDFYRKARQTISEWVKDPKPKFDFCNIDHQAGPLNGYQRRLIHQLVRNEFPGYQVFGRQQGSFMQVKKLDEEREAEYQKRQLRNFNARVGRQKGLRYIFEALVGGDLSDIEPEWFYDKDSEKAEDELKAIKLELEEILRALRTGPPLIVGHNLFTDLGFLYKTFIGYLPSKVEHFQEGIHELFPTVIDTKYLATQGQDSMNPRSNLKDLLAPFRKMHFPLILLHQDHTPYGVAFGKDHEAGYDSWMTAELFVKLTAKLYAERRPTLKDVDEDPASENDSEEEADCMTFSDDDDDDSEASPTGGVPLFSPNPFQALEVKPIKTKPKGKPKPKIKKDMPWQYYERLLNDGPGTKENENDPDPIETEQFIPAMTKSFWDIYVNKLRVTGTASGVCDLAEGEVVEE